LESPIYRNEAQIEFCDLLKRAERSGFKAADVARLLHLSKASISKIKSGGQTPRPAIIQALKRLVEDLGTETYGDMMVREESTSYAEKLFQLPEPKRELAKSLIDQLASDAAAAASSTVDQKKMEGIAVQSGVNQVLNYTQKKRRAAKTSGNKSTSIPESHPDSKSQSPRPAPDPKPPARES
jgi:transcriptional regulator with XRE-family HTH domain